VCITYNTFICDLGAKRTND